MNNKLILFISYTNTKEISMWFPETADDVTAGGL